jgi:hypothetical protein
MGTLVRFPLRHQVKIREDVARELEHLGARERVEILEDIDGIRRLGEGKLKQAMSISLVVNHGTKCTLYGVFLTSERVFLLKCHKNKLYVCAILNVVEETRRCRPLNETLIADVVKCDGGSARIFAVLTPAKTLLLFALIRANGLADELVARELQLAA